MNSKHIEYNFAISFHLKLITFYRRYNRLEDEDGELEAVQSDVRNHQKAVFDHLFHKAPEKLNQLQQNFNEGSK